MATTFICQQFDFPYTNHRPPIITTHSSHLNQSSAALGIISFAASRQISTFVLALVVICIPAGHIEFLRSHTGRLPPLDSWSARRRSLQHFEPPKHRTGRLAPGPLHHCDHQSHFVLRSLRPALVAERAGHVFAPLSLAQPGHWLPVAGGSKPRDMPVGY